MGRHEGIFCSFFQFQKSILSIHDIWFDRELNSASNGVFNVFLQWIFNWEKMGKIVHCMVMLTSRSFVLDFLRFAKSTLCMRVT